MSEKKNNSARTYRLSDNLVRNLSVFLSRVSLTGAEVVAFNDIMIAFASPLSDGGVEEKRNEENYEGVIDSKEKKEEANREEDGGGAN